MTYDLHIYFTGLCVFVPKLAEDGTVEEIRVLMPDASPSELPGKYFTPDLIGDSWSAHTAAVLFRDKNLLDSTGNISNRRSRREIDGVELSRRLWVLRDSHVDLTIDPEAVELIDPPSASQKLRIFDCGGFSQASAPYPHQPARCFHWIAPIKSQNEAIGEVDTAYLQDNLQSFARDRLTARFSFGVGEVRPACFTLNRDQYSVWTFGPDPASQGNQIYQAMATVVEMTCRCKAPITLSSRGLMGAGPSSSVTFGPKSDGERVELWFFNREENQVTRPRKLEQFKPDTVRRREIGYFFYNRLMKNPLPDPFLPRYCDDTGHIQEDDIRRSEDRFLRDIYFPPEDHVLRSTRFAPCCPGEAYSNEI